MSTSGKIHIFYDNECQLCIRFRDSLKYFCQNERFTFHGIHHHETYKLFPSLDKEKVKESLHVLTKDEKWLIGAPAIQYLVSECPKVESFKWLIQSQAGAKASEFFYQASDQLRRSLKKVCRDCGD